MQLPKSMVQSGHLLVKRQNIKSEVVEVYDIVRKKKVKYVGYAFEPLLDIVYGKDWREKYKLHFIASDGYRVSGKIKELLADADGPKGFLVFKEENQKGFTPYKKGKKEKELGPYYLIWSGVTEANEKKYLKTHKWPYQLKTINLKTSKNNN